MKHMQRLFAVLLAVVLALSCSTTAFANEGDLETNPSVSTTSEGSNNESRSWGLLSGESLKEAFMSLLTNSITDFLSGIINAIVEQVNSMLIKFLEVVFHAEKFGDAGGGTVLTASALQSTYNFIYAVACALVALKFIFKGFQIYILWRGGDADASPRDMLIGVAEATIAMIAFPWLYEKAVDVFTYLAEGIMGRLGVAGLESAANITIPLEAVNPLNWASAMITLILALIFFIMMGVLWIKLLRQGFELLIMRLGVPLATLGLIDSDMALFKNYVQTLLKVGLTVVVQVTLMSLAFRVIASFKLINIFAAIALLATAMSTPRLMQQFLTPQAAGGGGLANKAYSVAMVARAGKMLFV